jgi:hypothetical protein
MLQAKTRIWLSIILNTMLIRESNKASSQIRTSLMRRQEIMQLVEAWYLQALQVLWLRAAREVDSDLFKPLEEDLPIITPRCKMLT